MRIILAAALFVAMTQPALCGPVTDFLKLHDEPLGREQTETELMGVQSGFNAANAYLTGTLQQAPMYCLPQMLSLTADQLVDLLRQGVKEEPALDQEEVPSALLEVLRHSFPCASRTR